MINNQLSLYVLLTFFTIFFIYIQTKKYISFFLIQQLILYIACNNKLFMSTIDEFFDGNQRNIILDIGSGYNIWTKEFINKYINTDNDNCYIYNIDIIKYTEDYTLSYWKEVDVLIKCLATEKP